MAFVNPWVMVLGIGAALLPVLVHWLTRPRPVVLPLSTVRFVLQAVEQRRSRRRLRDVVILSLRTLAVLLVAAAIARPLFGRRPPAPADAPVRTARVVILDVSQSMAARAMGSTAIERVRPVAAAHLAYQPALAANLVLAGATPHAAFERLSTNYGALRDELGKAAPRPERLNVQAAFQVAAQMLAQAGGEGSIGQAPAREVIILSDFQRTQWAAADFSVFPRDTKIQLESAASGEVPPNVAILGIGGSGRVELGRPVVLEVDVGNFSNVARSVEVELSLPSVSHRLSAPCPAGTKTKLTVEIIPRVLGWQTGEVRLLGMSDALAEDDRLAFVLDVRQPPVFALITRENADTRPSSTYYLERALVPATAQAGLDRSAPRVVRFDPQRDDREILAAADLFVLDHPGRLSETLIASLAGWIRRGRSLLNVACEPADAGNLKSLADLAGGNLRLPVEFTPPLAGGARAERFITDARQDVPPFQVFGDALNATLAPLRFSATLASHSLPDALADDVRATYSDKSACLVVSNCGAGTLAILNADLGGSNLPTSSAFVPLIGELTTLLLGRRTVSAPVACGEPFALPLPPDAGNISGLTIVVERSSGNGNQPGPASSAEGIELTEEPDGLICRSAAAPGPGTIRVRRGERTVFALATAVPEQESDLAALPASVFQNRLAGDRTVSYRDAALADLAEDSLWTWLALGCAVVLVIEMILLRALRT
jgi:hypothetical protein